MNNERMENKPIVLLTFTSDGAEILCSKQLRVYRAYLEPTKGYILEIPIVSDYKQNPEGYSCFGSYYILERAKISKGLTLETSAGIYQW